MSAAREQAIDVRGMALEPWMAQRPNEIVPVIVGENEDDVAAPGLGRQRERGRRGGGCTNKLAASQSCRRQPSSVSRTLVHRR